MSSQISDLAALRNKVQSRLITMDGNLGASNDAKVGLPFDPILAPPEQPLFPRPNTNVRSYKDWEKRDSEPPSGKLQDLYNKFKGERCFIIGNGPTLNNHDLSKLKDEYVFAVNSFYYKTRETGFRPTFFVVEDDKVMEENYDQFVDYDCPYKLFPTEYKKYIPESDSNYFFKMNHGYYQDGNPYFGVPRFSTNAFDEVFCGQTVTYINLQLAHYMGFTQVYLIGMDFHYVIPKEHRRDGNLILSTTDDPNHFHKDYFGAGKTWKDPKLDRVAMNYRLAKLSFEASGRRVYNATIGGRLEIFDRVDYSSLFPNTKRRDMDGNLLLPVTTSYGEGSYQPKTTVVPVVVKTDTQSRSNGHDDGQKSRQNSSEAHAAQPASNAKPAAVATDSDAPAPTSAKNEKVIAEPSKSPPTEARADQPVGLSEEERLEDQSKVSGRMQLLERVLLSLRRRWMWLAPVAAFAVFPLLMMFLSPGTLFAQTENHLFASAILITGFAVSYIALRSYVAFRAIGSQLTFLSDQITIADKRRSKLASNYLGLRKGTEKLESSLDTVGILNHRLRAAQSDLEGLRSEHARLMTQVIANSGQNDRLTNAQVAVQTELKEKAASLATLVNRLSALRLELDDVSSVTQSSRSSLEALIEKADEINASVESNQISFTERASVLDERVLALEEGFESILPEVEQGQKDIASLSERTLLMAAEFENSQHLNEQRISELLDHSSRIKGELESVAPRTEQSAKDIHALSARTASMALQLEDAQALSAENQQGMSELAEKATELTTKVQGLETHSVGLDIAVVARSLRTMWLGGSGFERRTREVEREHGHVLLMDMLALIERERPGSLAGKSLIEIGMTREPYRSQRSTQKLGLFAALTDLYYVGVDIDPKNVDNAKRILRYLNPGAQAYVSKGEEFLRLYSGSIDFVYLDAYDFFHDNHSAERQAVYTKHLGSEISDEQCWKMHADCADTLIKRLSPGGVVALDDTWKDNSGDWAGKGKLAAPMFLNAGFEEIATSENTVCFKRKDEG